MPDEGIASLQAIQKELEEAAKPREKPDDMIELAKIYVTKGGLAIDYHPQNATQVENALHTLWVRMLKDNILETADVHADRKVRVVYDMVEGRRDGKIWTPGG